jgi:Zn finger protein HypA/HybF involved in hydrogenase expression
MRNLWGQEIVEETKVCRDCKIEKPITEFSINRKFYREDLLEKHRVIRRPSCEQCRSKKQKIFNRDKKFYKKPITLECPICLDIVDGKYARLDHSHDTGKIRGWLCDNCNTALGKLKESTEVIQRALNWVNKH